MSKETTPSGLGKKEAHLRYILSHLRDDLTDLIDGLETETIPYETVVAGAKTQLQWVLNELSRDGHNEL